MNYQRIYDQLIADRLANPPSVDEYAEVHHILPRCMGGADDAENLVRLRPEDHFFAHLLLAKIHDTPQMWGAVMVMHTRKARSELLMRKTRLSYGFARRRYGQLCSEIRIGEANPNFNPEKIELKHIDGRVVVANRLTWVADYGIPHALLCRLLNRGAKSAKGWMLTGTDPKTVGVKSGRHNVQSDVKIRYWRHIDGRVSVSDNRALAEKHGLRISDLSGVVRGAHGHHKGWYLDESRIGWSNKPNRKLGRDDAVYTLVKVDGLVACGNRRELAGVCGMGSRDLSAILLGTRRSSHGWEVMPATAANDNTQVSLFAYAS